MIPRNEIQKKTRELYPTFNSFLVELSPANLLVMYDDINTIEASISTPRLSIADIFEIYTDGKNHPGIEYLEYWIKYINDISNLPKIITRTRDVAVMIYKDHAHFYLTDLKIVFERIMRGEYGPFYGAVDTQRILNACLQYSIERNKATNAIQRELDEKLNRLMTEIATGTRRELYEELLAKGGEPGDRLKEAEKLLPDRFRKNIELAKTKLLTNRNK